MNVSEVHHTDGSTMVLYDWHIHTVNNGTPKYFKEHHGITENTDIVMKTAIIATFQCTCIILHNMPFKSVSN